jgi:hypothetical protein
MAIVCLTVAAPACGDGGGAPDLADAGPRDAGGPDAFAPDAAAGGDVDAGDSDAGAVDAGPVPSTLAIDRVFIDGAPDGQIRQGGTATIVVEGRGLFEIHSMGIDGASAAPTGGTDQARTWRIEVPHGHPIGATPLHVSSSGGAQDLAAITVTPIVYSHDGSPDGRGTYPSPVSICRGDDSSFLPRATDTMLLRAGTYECSHRIFVASGVIVRGEGLDRTVLAGPAAGLTVQVGRGTTEVHALTIAGPATTAGVLIRGGDAVIDDVGVEAGSIGVHMEAGGTVLVSRFGYQAPDGTGLRVDHAGAVLELSTSTISARAGIVATAGQVTIRDTRIDVTGDGIVTGVAGGDGGATVTMRGGSIEANRAIDALDGTVTVEGSTLTGADELATEGVRYDSATVTLREATLGGFDTGLALYVGTGARGGATLVIESSTVEARGVAIVAPGLIGGRLTVRRSRVEGLTALSVLGTPRLLDLGTHEAPGENALVGTAYAIHDFRIVAGPPIVAIGSTLNGERGAGNSIVGPVDSPPRYRLRTATQLDF